MKELKYLAAGLAIGFIARKLTEPRQRVVTLPCDEEQFNLQSGAAAVLTLCDACDSLTPVLGPIAQGDFPSVAALRRAFL